MGLLEEMRHQYQDQHDSLSLSSLLERLGGWWMNPAKQYATWVSPSCEDYAQEIIGAKLHGALADGHDHSQLEASTIVGCCRSKCLSACIMMIFLGCISNQY